MTLRNLIAFLIILVCTTSASQTSAQNRSNQWIEGAWHGGYIEGMTNQRSIRLIVDDDGYTVQYHEQGCNGTLSVIDAGEKKFKFIEKIQPTRSDSVCQSGGEVTIEFLDASHLKYFYKQPNNKKTTVQVVLRRISMNVAKPPPPPQYEKTGHRTTELLLETPKYKVYAPSFLNPCLKNMGVVSIVYNVNADQPIDISLETFMREVAPTIAEKCRGERHELDRFLVEYYIKDLWFLEDTAYPEVSTIFPTERQRSRPFIEVQYSKKINDRYEWEASEPMGVVGSLGFAKFRNENGRYLRQDLWSLSLYRKKIAEKKSENAVAELRQKERLAEEARLAPIRAKEKLRKEREANVIAAAGVLRFYKRGAPDQFDFTSYETKNFLRNVYSGNFEPFTGEFRTYDEWKADTLYSGFGNADVRDPLGFLLNLTNTAAKASEVRGRRDSLALSYYAYHITYREMCASDKEMPWGVSALEFYLTANNVEVQGSRKKGNVFVVREPFLGAFDAAYGQVGSTRNVSPSIPAPLQNDFRKFLNTEGCTSPTVRFFETNLYLAMRWQLPLQELKDFLTAEFIKPVATPTDQNAVPKPKTKPVPRY